MARLPHGSSSVKFRYYPRAPIPSLEERRKLARALIRRWRQNNPNPQCELYYRTPYQLLLSVMLSAQATDKIVNETMKNLYDQGFDEKTMLKLGEKGFYQKIKRIGLAPTKAKNAYALTKELVEKYKGKIPKNIDELTELPGVGRKTANVVLSELYGLPTLPVDTHAYRVTYRLNLQREKTPEKAEKVLLEIFPRKELRRVHHWLVLHGRYVCKAVKPRCDQCLIRDLCATYQEMIQ